MLDSDETNTGTVHARTMRLKISGFLAPIASGGRHPANAANSPGIFQPVNYLQNRGVVDGNMPVPA
jgi:hypothetical protein